MSWTAFRRLVGADIARWLLLGAVAGGVLGLVEVVVAAAVWLFADSLGLTPPAATRPGWAPTSVGLATALTTLVGVAVVRAIAHYVASQSAHEVQHRLNARLRRMTLTRMLLRGGPFVPAAEVHQQLADTFPKAAMALSAFASFATSATQATALSILLAVAAPIEASIALVGLALSATLVLRVNARVRAISDRIPHEQATIHQGIERVARSFVLVRVLGTEAHERARLVRAVDAFTLHARRATRLVSLAYAATPLLGTLLLVAIIALSRGALHTESTRLVAFLYLFVRFVQTLAVGVRSLSAANQHRPQLTASADFVLGLPSTVLANALAPVDDTPRLPRAPVRAEAPPAIALEDITYRYEGASADAVHGLALSIASGEQLAIVGPSGSGKSTVLLLVLGLLRPSAGRVLVGGRAAADQPESERPRIGYVGAEPFLVAGTLRENLLYGHPSPPPDDTVWKVLAQVRLDAVVRARPGALESVLDENGQGLSAGEQQRLCLARALLAEPTLLVLDEVSANLDAALEAEIVTLVASLRGRCTTIVVSHRPAMLDHADALVTMSAPTA